MQFMIHWLLCFYAGGEAHPNREPNYNVTTYLLVRSEEVTDEGRGLHSPLPRHTPSD